MADLLLSTGLQTRTRTAGSQGESVGASREPQKVSLVHLPRQSPEFTCAFCTDVVTLPWWPRRGQDPWVFPVPPQVESRSQSGRLCACSWDTWWGLPELRAVFKCFSNGGN